jgi:hypothetical protein
MGESNALAVKRGTPLRRDTALAAAAAYQHLYCEGMEEGDATDNIASTYQVPGPVTCAQVLHLLVQHGLSCA